MRKLFYLQTEDFDLTIWVYDVKKRLNSYQRMLDKRRIKTHLYKLNFSGAKVHCIKSFTGFSELSSVEIHQNSKAFIEIPIFFENLQYQFEWSFNSKINNARVEHYLSAVNDSFRFSNKNNCLIGNVNTGNDIGWFTLPIRYFKKDTEKHFTFKFEILPTKIDLHSDLESIYSSIDYECPLLRFKFLGKTEQDSSYRNQYNQFSLFWLSHFYQLRDNLLKGLKIIVNQPHQRLIEAYFYQKLPRLKDVLSVKQFEKIHNDIKQGNFERRYQELKKFLNSDIPENRFIKWILIEIQRELNSLILKIEKSAEFSTYLGQDLKNWVNILKRLERRSFLKEIKAEIPKRDSLVLQQKIGYAKVFSIWQELKLYLDYFKQQRQISIKSISELYEIWCFIEIKNILLNLGFKQVFNKNAKLKSDENDEYHLIDGKLGAFIFEKGNVKLSLMHEYLVKKDSFPLISYSIPQKPDILLEVKFNSNKELYFLFDAKYRIASNDAESEEDIVPDDALNQLHRYRDALISVSENKLVSKSRPVFGAFALYPGFFKQEKNRNDNPYKEMIEQIGIGAFALLPSQKNGNIWLRDFLKEKLLGSFESHQNSERLYLDNVTRISPLNMQNIFYRNLVMTIRIGDQRNEQYINHYKAGTAAYYHTKTNIFGLEFSHKIVSELQFLAIAYPNEDNDWIIDNIYPILNTEIKKRNELSEEESGIKNIRNSEESYYLFKLSKPIKLISPIINIPSKQFRKSIKLFTLDNLESFTNFAEIESIYKNVLIPELNI